MLIEAEAIPYEPALLRGERLLVLAPHPDDEVIGCGGVVAQHLRDGRAVRVVVATDGAQAGAAATREQESRRALDVLGKGAELEFLRFPDRSLGDAVATLLREQLVAFRPDLVLVPSPIEIHPDHLALARIFSELMQADDTLFAELAVTRVAFYEVGQTIRPNAIVDITAEADTKYAAIAEHATQLGHRDYVSYARGLNAYRAMTMPPETKFAEAYFVVELPSLRTTPFSELRRRIGAPPAIEVMGQTLPISVVVRTKDRPTLLREALDSIRANAHPCEIVVVNDGGARPDVEGVTLVEHSQSRGRAEAGNAGVRAASNAYVVFLDDDDLFYPEHLQTLANAAKPPHRTWYTDAVSCYVQSGRRMRVYAQHFDRDLLLVDNYIPLPTLLLSRADFLDAGGFDPQFDLFEDWDLLLRLSSRSEFLRIPRITCEIRHFEDGTSAVLAAPEGSEAFRAAKLRVWKKHDVGTNAFARAFEKYKRRLFTMYADAVEARGQAGEAKREAARLEREKELVIAQNAQAQDTINGYALRQRELEGAISVMTGIVADHQNKVLELERLRQEMKREVALRDAAIARAQAEIGELRAVNAEGHAALELLRVEVQRLNGLLDMIYRSKTWKVHTTLEKIRGRG